MTPLAENALAEAKFNVPAFAMVLPELAPLASLNVSVPEAPIVIALELESPPLVPLPTCNVPAEAIVAPV